MFLQPAVGILGGPGPPALWRERWAHPTGQAESSWVAHVRSFPFVSVDQAGGPGATEELSDCGNPNRNLSGDGLFLDLFHPFRWGCL